jgi:hypothetical protein
LLGIGALGAVSPARAATKKFTTCAALLKVYKSGVASTKKAKGKTKAVVSAATYRANKKLDLDGDGIACDADDIAKGSGAGGKKFTSKTYEGTDDKLVKVEIPAGFVAAAVVAFEGDDGVTITSYDADENMIDTPVVSYGPYKGTVLLSRGEDPDEPLDIVALDVAGEGKWRIKIIAASTLPLLKASAEGETDASYRYSGDDVEFNLIHEGDDSISVTVYDKDGILVERTLDEYGELDDIFAMAAGAFVVVRATAAWSLTLE